MTYCSTPKRRAKKNKDKKLTIPSDDNDIEQLQLSYIVSGDGKWYNHLEKLAVSPKVEYSLSIYASNTLPLFGVYPGEIKT